MVAHFTDEEAEVSKATELAAAHEAGEKSGFECPPGLLALLQECFLVGCVNLWNKPLGVLVSWTPSGSGHKPHSGIQRGACLD